MWKNSFKTKLVVSFTLINLAAITVASTLSLINMRKTIRQEIQNKLSLLADAKEGQVFAYLDSLESRTADFSSDGLIRENLKKIVDSGSPAAVEALNEHLIRNKKPLDENLFCIMILDTNGKVVSSVFNEEIGNDESSIEQFIEGKKGVFSGEEVGEAESESEKAIISVSAPVSDMNTGKLLGVIVNSFTTDKLDEILSGEYQHEKGAATSGLERSTNLNIHLVNKEKKVLAHGHRETEHTAGTIDSLPVRRCLDNNKEFAGVYFNDTGTEVIGASTCLLQRKWTLVTEIGTREAYAPVRNASYGLVIIFVLTLIFIVLDIYLIAGRFVRPIEKLHKASDIIAKGNLDYRVDIKTKDELEQLAEAFNRMAANLKKNQYELKQYSSGLEVMVAEKTKDLHSKVDDLNKTREAILNVAEDVEKKNMKLSIEKNKINAILHSIGDGVFVVDKNLKVILVNETAAKMTGYKIEEIIGTKYTEKLVFVSESTGKINDQFIKKVIETKTRQEMSNHTVLIGKNGSKTPVADSSAPLLDDTGNLIGCVVVFRDTTKERRLEQMKDDFLSIAAHELRAPLGIIKAYTSMIFEGDFGKVPGGLKEPIADISGSTERLIRLVNDMLNVSRIEAGRIIFKLTEFSISNHIKKTVAEFGILAKQKGVTVTAKKIDDTVIQADPDKMQELLHNLINNSLKFTDSGSITVSTKREGDLLKVFVADTGIGISKEDQNKIFGKFQQIATKQAGKPKGTGLGLYISQELAQKMGGNTWLESSAAGKGSIFAFSLPVAGSKLAMKVRKELENEAKLHPDQK